MAPRSEPSIGVFLVTFGGPASPEAFARLAGAADGVVETLCVGDHVTLPAEIPDEYPFSPTGESPFSASQDAYDAFQVLSYLAGRTDDVRLGTNTAIAPYRHPVALAKQALTLDALTGGRFEFGLAPGWMRTEFEVLDVPFEERGTRTDEFLDLFDRVCGEGELSFEGPHHAFQKTGFHPRPVQEGGPPIWVGGRSGATFRRVGEHGTGWTIFPDGPAQVRSDVERLERAWAAHDRPGDPAVAVTLTDYPVHVGDGRIEGDREALVDRLGAYVDAGATRLFVMPQAVADDAEGCLQFLEWVVDDVAPRL